ncbi:aldose 1-epimerase [Aquimarina sp. U1-2]|uniref:aldose 1-epimerase n=1 Tax=Aquimarina sp. U1-2 TaxID=2823141 RepID=UPI001AECBF7F|nr:aldose 1-epimerase [Aquimarina sp. U1-2]MBP2830875.1 aldose 1-epimerase [Aquimarina sp. U1-2]
MYTITHKKIKGRSLIALSNAAKTSKAELCLDQGGRLSSFTFEGIQVIADPEAIDYSQSYASSILFPFANRIKDGTFSLDNTTYTLDCNDTGLNNALHGLVYDKSFTCIHQEATVEQALVTLVYEDKGLAQGFPFAFKLQFIYILDKNGIQLAVSATNTDKKSFPFSMGWHPYFVSKNLYESYLIFNSSSQYTYDHQKIINGSYYANLPMPFQVEDHQLDQGFTLEESEVQFLTPEYNLTLSATKDNQFLQVYTPPQGNTIAIEPMTGAPNNFNTKTGLQMLVPKATYTTEWCIAIKSLLREKKDG